MANKTLYVEFDREAFKKAASDLFAGSPKIQELSDELGDLKITNLTSLAIHAHELALVAAAAIEVMKSKTTGVDGKFDPAAATDIAIEILDEAIAFKGWLGEGLEKIDRPIFKFMVKLAVDGQPKNWLESAKYLVGLK